MRGSPEKGGITGRSSVTVYASGIRAFFRHAERKGRCRRGLANVIESPCVYQYEAAQLLIARLDLGQVPSRDFGNAPARRCPFCGDLIEVVEMIVPREL
ncbi:MAG: hypothetical protein ABSH56_28320 [Bryobacteraceae bacterium]|jgi:hypothetical protein